MIAAFRLANNHATLLDCDFTARGVRREKTTRERGEDAGEILTETAMNSCQLAHAAILISSSRARPKPRESITSSRRSHPLVLPPLTKESPCTYNPIKRSRE